MTKKTCWVLTYAPEESEAARRLIAVFANKPGAVMLAKALENYDPLPKSSNIMAGLGFLLTLEDGEAVSNGYIYCIEERELL